MTTGSALRPAAMLLFSLAACHPETSEPPARPPACNLDEQQTQLADVVTTLAFDARVIGELGIAVRSTGATAAAPQHALAIPTGPASSFDGASECLAIDVADGHLRDFVSGRTHTGGPTLRLGSRSVSLDGFELRVGDEPRTFDLVTAAGERVLAGTLPHYAIDPASGVLDVFNVDLSLAPGLAARWGAPHLADTVIGTLSLRARVVGATGTITSALGVGPLNACNDFSGNVDVALIAMDAIQQQGRLGDQVVITPSAVLKNVGTANVPWQARFSGNQPPYNIDQHPYLVWSLFREVGGVFEPLAYSDVKHAFLTINSNCAPGSSRPATCSGSAARMSTASAPTARTSRRARRSCQAPAPGRTAISPRRTRRRTSTRSRRSASRTTTAAPRASSTTAWSPPTPSSRWPAPTTTSRAGTWSATTSTSSTAWAGGRSSPRATPTRGRSGSRARTARARWSTPSSIRPRQIRTASTSRTRMRPAPSSSRPRSPISATTSSARLPAGPHDSIRSWAFSLSVARASISKASFRDGDNDATNNWLFTGGIGQLTWVAPKVSARLSWGTAVTISFVANGGPIRSTVRLTRGDTGGAMFVKTLIPDRISI